ncbi:hypothetical protein MUN82_08680 [Hymenobacter aerilatus]|uniref:Uncharacterized protein n=1 Tax=Hymenobacter aerilatus TaxID=2932251 RepID=A0A8T9SZW4_9BACT|nr:hypothetical protein [Hymenobacter aerilatus]UOR07157.1 hypothetical protein MUN82_08680 [Hymenobacter aerilatus]
MAFPVYERRLLTSTSVETAPGQYRVTRIYYNPVIHASETEVVDSFQLETHQIEDNTVLDEYCEGSTYVLRYSQGGQAERIDNPNHGSCPIAGVCDLRLETFGTNTTDDPAFGSLFFTASTSNGPASFSITVAGVSYVVGQVGDTPNYTYSIPTEGVYQFVFKKAPAGRYRCAVQDAATCQVISEEVRIFGPGETDNQPADPTREPAKWLKYFLFEEFITDDRGENGRTIYVARGTAYDFATRDAYDVAYQTDPAYPAAYSRPTTEIVDAYYLPDGITYRRLYHDGNYRLRVEDTIATTPSTAGELRLLNLIKTDIDSVLERLGDVWVEADSPALPLSFTEESTGETNTTGQFDNLPAGQHTVRVQDAAGRSIEAKFTIEDRYRVRWRLEADDLFSTSLRVEIEQQDWAGGVTSVCGAASPAQRSYAETGSSPDGILPEAIGSGVTLRLRTSQVRQFVDIVTKHDRFHRVSVYRADILVFRGFVDPSTYQEPLLGIGQEVSFDANDGLGALADTEFLNHIGEDMLGRRPLLATVLHCLSRCDVNLPLYNADNLRDVLMGEDADPLAETWGWRTAYYEQGKTVDCRTVLNSILRRSNCLLVQRMGAWWIVSLNEVEQEYDFRAFHPNGLPAPLPDRPLPRHVVPPQEEDEFSAYWLDENQSVSIVGSAKVVQATVQRQFVENQLENGTFQLWNPTNTQPINWTVEDAVSTGNFFFAGVRRVSSGKAGQYALALYADAYRAPASAGLLSPPMPHQPDPNEARTVLRLRAKVEAPVEVDGQPKPKPNFVRLRFEVLDGGAPVLPYLTFSFSSEDKEVTVEQFIPFGLVADTIRVRLLPPQLLDNGTLEPVPVTGNGQYPIITIYEIGLQIRPNEVFFEDTETQFAVNENGFLLLPTVELVHDDLPRFQFDNGNFAPVRGMDVQAWRHALTLADGRATTSWSRPGTRRAAGLLETAALDRLELRTFPGEVLTGTLRGRTLWQWGIGLVVDAVFDADGKYVVVGYALDEHEAEASIALRKLGSGRFGQPTTLFTRLSSTGDRRVTADGRYRIPVD